MLAVYEGGKIKDYGEGFVDDLKTQGVEIVKGAAIGMAAGVGSRVVFDHLPVLSNLNDLVRKALRAGVILGLATAVNVKTGNDNLATSIGVGGISVILAELINEYVLGNKQVQAAEKSAVMLPVEEEAAMGEQGEYGAVFAPVEEEGYGAVFAPVEEGEGF